MDSNPGAARCNGEALNGVRSDAIRSGGPHAHPRRGRYAVDPPCESYGKRLDKIPPPLDPGSPGAVYESIGLALPLLREQSAKVHALTPS